jgi:hypothetical protein
MDFNYDNEQEAARLNEIVQLERQFRGSFDSPEGEATRERIRGRLRDLKAYGWAG